jgi:response regulator NasT
MRSIIVAFPDIRQVHRIKEILLADGFRVDGEALSGSMTLCQIASRREGGVVVCGPLFTDMSAGHLQTLLPEEYDMLVLASPGSVNLGYERMDGLYTLSLPIKTQDLLSSVRMLLETRQMPSNELYRDRLRGSGGRVTNTVTQRGDAERRILEKAKAILMDRNQMSEQEAHRFLQKKSMDNGWRMIDTAQAVIRTLSK